MADLEGTQGEPETAAAGSQGEDLSSTQGGESGEPAQPGADSEHWKWLESQDPGKFPAAIRQKLEAPFLSNYTRKMTEANEQANAREQRLLDAVTNRLAAQGVQTTPDQTAELREKIKMGDFDVVDQFVERTVQSQLAPVHQFMQQSAMDRAIQQAQQSHPWVKEKELEIGAFLKANPAVARFAAANNYEAAPLVLRAIAQDMELAHLKATRQSEIDAAVAKAKQAASTLPSTTSRAGSTPTGIPTQRMGLREAMEKAALVAGLPD